MTEPAPLTTLDHYRLIRERIEHEDNLIVQRLSWLVASQSFLFTAYAIVLNGLSAPPPTAMPSFVRQMMAVHRLIPIVAILTSSLIYAGVLAAVRAMAQLRRLYSARVGAEAEVLPPIQVATVTRRFGFAAPVLLPLVFIVVWLLLWLRGL